MARVRLVGVLACALLLAGTQAPLRPGTPPPARAAVMDSVTLSMGYIPNVQFAPFYLADARGYYAAAHIKVTFDYKFSPDIVKLIGAGNVTFGNVEADQVVVGRASGLQVTSVLTQYQRFPVVIFAKQSSHIRGWADLRGKTIGIPALYGASYLGLLAALQAAHLTTHDVKIETIGYTQVAQVAVHHVDAAVGYAMNEPVELAHLGYKVTVLPIASLSPLAGAGVVTSQRLIQQRPDLVRRFAQATYRGLSDTNANPAAAFAASRHYITGISGSQVALQQAVLQTAIGYWTPSKGGHLGCAAAGQWSATQKALVQQQQIKRTFPVSTFFTNQFLPTC